MATYNGAKYIRQQMESILSQSRQPDEVILCDDGSADETVQIIKSFIRDNGLQDTWRLFQNEQNRGYPGNFYYAMSLCGGDLIFLADQDDLWHREKIRHMYRVFEEHPEAAVVCCKLSLIDAEGADIHSIMTPTHEGYKRRKGNLRQISIQDVFYKCEWPGMVTAYRQDWYRNQQHGNGGIPHDFLICATAAEQGSFYQMDEILACHRRHDNNAGGRNTVWVIC